ncbi:translin-associated protein X [Ciona intestinalis]
MEPVQSQYSDSESRKTDILAVFMQFRDELDVRYNLHEQVVKLGRDITVESKKLIFHLHRNNVTTDVLMLDAEKKKTSILKKFHEIAKLLVLEDSLQFIRAYSPGLQEFIEAMSFMQFLKLESQTGTSNIHTAVLTLKQVKDILIFPNPAATGDKNEHLTLAVPLVEYLLGLADVTGEAMRMCINCAAESIGSSDLNNSRSYKLCAFVRILYNAFQVCLTQIDTSAGRMKLFKEKLRTMHSSLIKCEDACYTVKVRGQEIPNHLLKTELLTVGSPSYTE